MCTALECRFDDTSVVKATAIADFKMWPTSEEELHTFGDHWMNTLLDQFGSYLDDKDDQIKAEWPMLKTAVLEAFWCHLIQHGYKSTEDLGMNTHMC